MIRESFFISVPVAVQHSIPNQEIAVSFAHMQTSIVRPNREKKEVLQEEDEVNGIKELSVRHQ